MKKLIFASGLLALLATATSCEKYDIYPEDFDSVFTIRDAGTKELALYATDQVVEYPVIIMKGGYDPETKSTATLKVMNQEEFDAYNADLGYLPYVLVAPECYSLSATEQVRESLYEFDSADKKAVVANVYLKPSLIHKWISENADLIGNNTPVIPITLVSETDTVNSYASVELLKVAVSQPEFHFSVDEVTSRNLNKQTFSPNVGENDYKVSATIEIPCLNPWGFTLNLVDDPSIISDYNDDYGTTFRILNKEYYTFQPTYEFKPGVVKLPIELTITPDDLAIGKTFAVALRFANPKQDGKEAIVWDDPENNPGDALKLDKDRIMIFTVRVNNNKLLTEVNLNANMVTSNDVHTSDGGGVAALFDNDPSSYFHSWYDAGNSSARNATYGSYLEITLPEPKTLFRFQLQCRNSNAAGAPKTVYLYGTNDPNNWPTTPFGQITNMTEKLNGGGAVGDFGTDDLPFGDGTKEYKYIRFCVMEAASGSLTAAGATYWNAAEFKLFAD